MVRHLSTSSPSSSDVNFVVVSDDDPNTFYGGGKKWLANQEVGDVEKSADGTCSLTLSGFCFTKLTQKNFSLRALLVLHKLKYAQKTLTTQIHSFLELSVARMILQD